MDPAPTWRDTGRFLTPGELAGLNDEQTARYFSDSTVRSLDEIDDMPEPERTVFRRLTSELEEHRQHRNAS